jgi:ribulose-5-phosphate 4-epimerase/fuculose-1-phosphate aldolase
MTVMEDEAAKLRAEVTLSCRILAREGVTRLAFGHVSAKLDEERILIKARGPEEEALELVTERDVIIVNAEGRDLQQKSGLTPPNETPIHTSLYRARGDVGSVIHAHPAWVVALLASGRQLLPLYGAYDPSGLQLALDGIPIYESSVLISTPELGDDLAATLDDKGVCVLRGHGIVGVGGDVQEATANVLALHELARVNWLAYAVGEPAAINPRDSEILAARRGSATRPRRRADGDTPQWHFYRQQLGVSSASSLTPEVG